MNDSTTILFDYKKNRFRIPKDVCRSLGNPAYIQLLINPSEMLIGIKAMDFEIRGEQTFKITKRMNTPKDSVEFTSKSFMCQVRNLLPEVQEGHSYRLTGTVMAEKRIAIFKLNTIRCIDRQEE